MKPLGHRHVVKKIKIICIALAFTLIAAIAAYYLVTRERPVSKDASKSAESEYVHPTPRYINPSAPQTGVDDVETDDDSGSSAAFPTTQPNLSIRITKIIETNRSLSISTRSNPAVQSGSCIFRLDRQGKTLLEKSVEISADGQCTDPKLEISQLQSGEIDVTVLLRVGDNVANYTQNFIVK